MGENFPVFVLLRLGKLHSDVDSISASDSIPASDYNKLNAYRFPVHGIKCGCPHQSVDYRFEVVCALGSTGNETERRHVFL